MSGEPTSNAGFELRDPVQSGEARPAEQSVADPSGVAPASRIHRYCSGGALDRLVRLSKATGDRFQRLRDHPYTRHRGHEIHVS